MPEEAERDTPSEVRFMPSPQMWRYLNWLSRHTVLGENLNECGAKQILAAKLSEMRREEFKDPEKS